MTISSAWSDLPRPVKTGSGIVAFCIALAIAAVAYWKVSTQREDAIAKALTGGDPRQAPSLIRRYGCGGCHTISAIAGADGKVAAPLDQLRKRVYIGGVLQNTPDNLVRWIVSPREFSPLTAMPETGITEAEARHVAAFLYRY
jgi:cytochrome c